MKVTQEIIEQTRGKRILPKARLNAYLRSATHGCYKKWLKEAKRFIEQGEPVTTDEEIRLLDFFEAYELEPIRCRLELVDDMGKSNAPKDELQKEQYAIKPEHEKLTELTMKLNKIRPSK